MNPAATIVRRMDTSSRTRAVLTTAIAAVLACACSRSEPENFFRVEPSARVADEAPLEPEPSDAESTLGEAPSQDIAEIRVDGLDDAPPGDGSGPGREAALRYMTERREAPEVVAGRMAERAVPVDVPDAAAPRARTTVSAGRPVAQREPVTTVAEPTAQIPRSEAVALDPDGARELNRIAITHIAAGRTAQAITALERALELQPRDAEILGNLGYAYMLAGDHRAARARLVSALDIAPTRSATWLNLGQTYAEMGQRDVAVEAVVKGYRYSTRKPSVRSALQRAASGRQFDPGWREAAALALDRIGADTRS
ncbi:hypothetical protein GCM10027188_17170 [Lysobacter humi (ex Lee et al. 2017)]